MLEIEGLVKNFGSFSAVNNINIHVASGEIFGFLGPNGAGKTTTIKCIAGLIKASAGDIRVDGFSLRKQAEQAKRRLGLIPDRPYLYDKLSGLEFLEFLAGIYGLSEGESRDRARQLLSLFALTDWGDELIEGYSHGMKQRLIMAGALLHRPSTLVIDEPMVGLDPDGARLIKRILRRYAEAGHAILLSTHSLPVAESLCHRIGIISGGTIIAEGNLNDLRERAQNQGDLESVFLTLTREAALRGEDAGRNLDRELSDADLDLALGLPNAAHSSSSQESLPQDAAPTMQNHMDRKKTS